MRYRITATIIAILACLTPTGAQVTKSGTAYLFRLKYKAGQQISYSLLTQAKFPSSQKTDRSVVVPIVLTARKVGKTSSDVSFVLGPVKVDGVKQIPKKDKTGGKQTVSATISNQGVIAKSDAAKDSSLNYLYFEFPDKAIKPGYKWNTTDVASVQNSGSITSRMSYEFVGVKKVGAKTVAEFKTSVTGLQNSLTITGNGKMYIRVEDGTLDSSVMNIIAKPTDATPGASTYVVSTIQLSRTKG